MVGLGSNTGLKCRSDSGHADTFVTWSYRELIHAPPRLATARTRRTQSVRDIRAQRFGSRRLIIVMDRDNSHAAVATSASPSFPPWSCPELARVHDQLAGREFGKCLSACDGFGLRVEQDQRVARRPAFHGPAALLRNDVVVHRHIRRRQLAGRSTKVRSSSNRRRSRHVRPLLPTRNGFVLPTANTPAL
jgi:hypothetical protein